MQNENQKHSKAGKKEWLGFLVLALTCMLYSMDLTVLNLAVPQLSHALNPSPTQLLWIVDIYGFFLGGALITMGTLGDRIGRRKILLLGGGFFATISALAAFSTSPEMLIALRALQGIAGATIAPSTLSLIRVLFNDPKERTLAMGLWGTSFSVGGLIGPLVGGLLIEHFWWGSVFLINVPVMLIMLILGPILLPEFKATVNERIDWLSTLLSLSAILLIILSLKKSIELGLSWFPVTILIIGLILLYLFIKRQTTLTHPIVDLKLFKSSKFNSLMTLNFTAMLVVFGTFLFTNQYLQLVMELPPLEAGAWSIFFSIGFIISANLSPILVRRIKPSIIMSLGLLLGAIGFTIISQIQGATDLYWYAFGTLIFSIGLSPVLMFTTGMLVNSAPAEKAGSAAALSETANELGGATGIALLGSLGTFLYHQKLSKLVPESTLSAEQGSAFRGTLESALSSIKSLPTEQGLSLKQSIFSAYTHSFTVVMLVSASLLCALAFFVFTKLKDVKIEDEH